MHIQMNGRFHKFAKRIEMIMKFLGNIIWILLGWWEIALIHLVCGLIFCVTIVGIPWGLQHFKMTLSSVFPFGKEIR